ncbi:MAG: 16S rRNA (uracil(1498)-N(3))-methyltransferase [Pontibacterium sp.]
MNLLLLSPDEIQHNNRGIISAPNDRRLIHINQVQKPAVGDSLRVGVIGGNKGTGRILTLSEQYLELDIELNQPPPKPLALNLVMALPRPKMLKRILQSSTSMGVKDIYFINTYRVDKSYWSTPILQGATLTEQLLLGLEQAGDTHLPKVHLKKRFKPFVEDELPSIAANTRALVAHPYKAASCPCASDERTTLAIGPEGGFIDYEVTKLNEAGLKSVHIGERILRVETAVPVLLAKLCL